MSFLRKCLVFSLGFGLTVSCGACAPSTNPNFESKDGKYVGMPEDFSRLSVFRALPEPACEVRAIWQDCLLAPGLLNNHTDGDWALLTEQVNFRARTIKDPPSGDENHLRNVFTQNAVKYLKYHLDIEKIMSPPTADDFLDGYPYEKIRVRNDQDDFNANSIWGKDSFASNGFAEIAPHQKKSKTERLYFWPHVYDPYCDEMNIHSCLTPSVGHGNQRSRRSNKFSIEYLTINDAPLRSMTYAVNLIVRISNDDDASIPDACEVGIQSLQKLSEVYLCAPIEQSVLLYDPDELYPLVVGSTDIEFPDTPPRKLVVPVPPTPATNFIGADSQNVGVGEYLKSFLEPSYISVLNNEGLRVEAEVWRLKEGADIESTGRTSTVSGSAFVEQAIENHKKDFPLDSNIKTIDYFPRKPWPYTKEQKNWLLNKGERHPLLQESTFDTAYDAVVDLGRIRRMQVSTMFALDHYVLYAENESDKFSAKIPVPHRPYSGQGYEWFVGHFWNDYIWETRNSVSMRRISTVQLKPRGTKVLRRDFQLPRAAPSN